MKFCEYIYAKTTNKLSLESALESYNYSKTTDKQSLELALEPYLKILWLNTILVHRKCR